MLYKEILNAKRKKDLPALLYSKLYPLLAPSFIYDKRLEQEFYDFITTDKDDINYDFSRKRI